MATAILLTAAGLWGGLDLYQRAKASERRARLFASERVLAGAQVTRIQRRGGGNNRRSTVHYRYTARGRDHAGMMTVRRSDRDRYVAGAPVGAWYLDSQPDASWLDGYAPATRPAWPALAVPAACTLATIWLVVLVRRQRHLATYGRPAIAVVTRVEKKRSDKGTYWQVHYEWTLLSGAKRSGRYHHGRKQPPGVGTTIAIVYDRDQPARHSKYPLSLVAVSQR